MYPRSLGRAQNAEIDQEMRLVTVASVSQDAASIAWSRESCSFAKEIEELTGTSRCVGVKASELLGLVTQVREEGNVDHERDEREH